MAMALPCSRQQLGSQVRQGGARCCCCAAVSGHVRRPQRQHRLALQQHAATSSRLAQRYGSAARHQRQRGSTGVAPALAPATVAVAAAAAPASLWAPLAVLTSCAALAQLAEEHTRWGRLLSAPLIALLAALGAASLGLLPPASPVYDVVWSHLMPLAVALLLLENDVSSIAAAGGPVLAAFLTGTATMLIGAGVAWALCGSGLASAAGSAASAAKLASCMVASYVGGSVNFVAVASATQLPAALMPGAMATDNLGMLAALALLTAAPVRLAQQMRLRRQQQQEVARQQRRLAAWRDSVLQRSGFGAAAAGSTAASAAVAPVPAATPTSSLGLDGQPLLTEPPSAQDTAHCMAASSSGRLRARRAAGSGSDSSGNDSSSSSSDSSMEEQHGASPLPPLTAAEVAAGVCGGCRGSGVTALDEHPLLTRAPGMGDAIDTIAAARSGRPQLMTPPKPPGAGTWVVRPPRAGSPDNGNGTAGNGSISSSAPDAGAERFVGCGGCQDALDAIAAASPAPSFPRPPSRLASNTRAPSAAAAAAAAAAGASPASSSSSSSSRGSPVLPSLSGGGALALDGSPLLTDAPDAERLAVAVATARSGSSSSSVAVTPLSSGEFELLVTLDRDSLLARLKDYQAQLLSGAAVAGAPASQQQSAGSGGGAHAPAPDGVVPLQLQRPRVVTVEAPPGTLRPPSSSRVRARGGGGASGGASGGFTGLGSSALSASSGAAALAAAACACAASQQAAAALGVPALQQLLLAAAALGLSVAGSAAQGLLARGASSGAHAVSPAAAGGARGPFEGASQLGQLLIGVFFAALGASCCCPLSTLVLCGPLAAFCAVMTATHWALLAALGGGLLRLPAPVLLCGSAAAVGGPMTAAGLAAARGWRVLVRPSLLCGSLGYALGTGAGLGLAKALGAL